MPGFSSPAASSKANSLRTERKAANVFPVPVGEMIRTLLPASIRGQAFSCAGVGSAKFFANHSVTTDDLSNGTGAEFHEAHGNQLIGLTANESISPNRRGVARGS